MKINQNKTVLRMKKQDNHSNQINKQIIYSLIYFHMSFCSAKHFLQRQIQIQLFQHHLISVWFVILWNCNHAAKAAAIVMSTLLKDQEN